MLERNTVTDYIEAGLKASSLRQSLIANNIANLGTKGYRRKDIDFEKVLLEAMESGRIDMAQMEAHIFEPQNTPVNSDGNDVSLEMEIGEMVDNTSMYKTYLRLMSKMYRQMELAMSTGD